MYHPMCGPPHLHGNPHQFIVGMIILGMMTQVFMIYQRHSWSQNLAGLLTIAYWTCKISNALFTSFLAVTCVL
jgi:hypothetical protein